MMRQLFIILIMLTLCSSQKINLNSASIEKLYSLDLSDDKIESIIDYRNRSGNIHNIYELLEIPNITILDIHYFD